MLKRKSECSLFNQSDRDEERKIIIRDNSAKMLKGAD